MKRLSNNLKKIYDLELKFGNKVLRIDEPAGTKCPLAVVFKDPIHFSKIEEVYKIPETVKKWENHDQHYPIEAGFVCEITNHVIAGPIVL